MQGILDFSKANQAINIIIEVTNIITPNATTILLHAAEAAIIPILPQTVLQALISDEALPVSDCCWSNRILVLNGLTAVPIREKGIKVNKNSIGAILPKFMINTLQIMASTKQSLANLALFIRLKNFTNKIGPINEQRALMAKK